MRTNIIDKDTMRLLNSKKVYKTVKKQISILLIDDNTLDVLIIKALLGRHFNIISVNNASEASIILEEFYIDMILMDHDIENYTNNKLTILKKIRLDERFSHIHFIAIDETLSNEHNLIKQGFDEVYTKPILKEDVLNTLIQKFDYTHINHLN
ncbi:MAG: response regulator [Bacteroidia bacterium]|nr:response regulator [Bacteroidia bacterium]